jgi:flagellar hook-associated protein 2
MAAVSFSGLDGIDLGAVIDATINAERTPLNILKQRQTYIQSRDSALSSFSSSISTMESQASSLVSESMFTNATAISSNTGVGSAIAGGEAINGTYSLQVDRLAKAQVTASTTDYSVTDAIVADGGSISFTINGTTTISIDITAGTLRLSLQNSINAQNSDVVDSIVNNGTCRKVVIASRETCSGSTTALGCASMKVRPGSIVSRLKRQSNC